MVSLESCTATFHSHYFTTLRLDLKSRWQNCHRRTKLTSYHWCNRSRVRTDFNVWWYTLCRPAGPHYMIMSHIGRYFGRRLGPQGNYNTANHHTFSLDVSLLTDYTVRADNWFSRTSVAYRNNICTVTRTEQVKTLSPDIPQPSRTTCLRFFQYIFINVF